MRKRHLTVGWCWRADIDGDPAVWGIYGHVDDAQALSLIAADEGIEESGIKINSIVRDYRRSVPCAPNRDVSSCGCDGCPGTRLERADGPGPGAMPHTWVKGEVL